MGFPDFKCVFMYQGLRRWKGLKKPQLFQEEKGHFTVQILCTPLFVMLQKLPIDLAAKGETDANPVLCSEEKKQ